MHAAADGGLARVRLPGGQLSAEQLRVLADCAEDLGDGRLELTSRANVQLRALALGSELELADRIADAGLLPSPTHELVRNILASPLAGIDGVSVVDGLDVAALAAELDQQLCARPALADLPGRFLFAIDDGRGDVARAGADVTLTSAGGDVELSVADVPVVAVPLASAVTAALLAAEIFVRVRASQQDPIVQVPWRIAELDDGGTALRDELAHQLAEMALTLTEDRPSPLALTSRPPIGEAPSRPIGLVSQPDGRWCVILQAPLGRLSVEQARLIAGYAGSRGVRVTAWHSVAVPDLLSSEVATTLMRAAETAGLGTSDRSPWFWISSCTGSPGCAKSLADVQADARQAAADFDPDHPGALRVLRYSGCARRCGQAVDTELELVASGTGYLKNHTSPRSESGLA